MKLDLRKKVYLPISFVILSLVFYAISNRSDLLPASFASSLFFWSAIALLIPNKFFKMVWNDVKKTKAYWVPFSIYLFFHVTLYGIFYNLILGGFNFFPYFGYGVGASIPTPPYLFVYWVSLSPAFFSFIGPYESDVTPYSLFLGLLLSTLIGANVQRIIELRKLIKERKRSLITITAVPSLGVISGTSCCLSLPSIIIYVAAVSTGTFSSVVPILASPIFFTFSYFGLPIASLALLVFNLRDINKVIRRLTMTTLNGKMANPKGK